MKEVVTTYKYIEILDKKTGECHHRRDVSYRSDEGVDRIMNGISIKLDHSKFILNKFESTDPYLTF